MTMAVLRSRHARLALALCSAMLAACATAEGYDNNDAELAVRQKAKETCSCLFVMELSEEQCAAWTKVSPNVAQAKIDWKAQRVDSVALGFWSASAHYTGRTGCVLDD
jgi:hypothetical protein